MIEIDRTQWPLVFIEVDGLTTLAAMQEYNAEMEDLLDFVEAQGDNFGIVYLSQMNDDEFKDHKREKAAQKLGNQWLKTNKGRIGTYCIGIAMVTQATNMMKVMKPIARISMKRMMGAPGDVFFAREEAVTWMTKKMGQV